MSLAILDNLDSVLSSSGEKTRFIRQKYENTMTALQPRRDRLFDNLQKYAGNIIPVQAAMAMAREDREQVIINLYVRKVQDIASAIAENIWDVNFSNPYGEATSLLYSLYDHFKKDQANCLWDTQFLECLKMALISDASMEMQLNTDENPMGDIAWAFNGPGVVSFDPYWRSMKSSDCEFDFKTMDLTPRQIKLIYQAETDKINNAILIQLHNGNTVDIPTIDYARKYQDIVTGTYKVIEYNYLEYEPRTVEMDAISQKELPKTDDIQFKIAYCQANGIELENVREITANKKVLKVCTICPSLMDTPLYDGEHTLQIERLPHFPLSTERINGEPRSIVDIIAPMVQAINKRENNVNAIMDYASKGGGAWDPMIVGNDPAEKERLRSGFGKAGFNFFTAPGALANGQRYYEPFGLPQIPSGVIDQIKHLWDSISETIPVNSTMGGTSDYAGEPGVLFNLKMQSIERALTCLTRQVENFMTEIGQAYVKAAKNIYTGATRAFFKPNGERVALNDIQPLPNGDVAILNDMGALGSVTVITKLSPQSPNSRYTKRMTNLEIAKSLPPDPEYAELRAQCWKNVVATIDLVEDEDNAIEAAGNKSVALAGLRIDAETARLKASMNPSPAPEEKPSLDIPFDSLPYEGQVQVAAMAGIKLPPMGIQQPQQAQPMQQAAPQPSPVPPAQPSGSEPSPLAGDQASIIPSEIPQDPAAMPQDIMSQNATQLAPLAAK